MKTSIPSTLITIALVCFGLLPNTQAVSPPPDGGYAGGNTAEGQNALLRLANGTYNTAVGLFSLESLTGGSFNTAIGAGTLLANTADSNTATGAGALLSNTTGGNNTATGESALFFNTTGSSNTANGVSALQTNTTGGNNTATGFQALFNNTTAFGNTANGYRALTRNTNGAGNTAIGSSTLQNNTTGGSNTAIGSSVLFNNTTGDSNTALGATAGFSVTTASSVICIGSFGANVSNSCFIGNIREVQTQNANAIPVLIDSAGQLGTISSSRRFKNEIKSMDSASEAILALKPVTFHYKSDKTATAQFGLIAEEVANVNPDLVVRDKNGEIYTVRYEAVNAMLLNEFLKAHRKMEEQEATIAQLKEELQATAAHEQKQIEALTAGLHRVSAQLEASKPASQVVSNP